MKQVAEKISIIEEIARGTGTVDGMIGGQVVDLEAEHTKPDLKMLEYIHRAKTAAWRHFVPVRRHKQQHDGDEVKDLRNRVRK